MCETPSSVSAIASSEFAELPPSSKTVAVALDREGELTQTQLANRTQLSARTVRSALSALEDCGLVTVRPSVRDARHRLYSLNGPSAD